MVAKGRSKTKGHKGSKLKTIHRKPIRPLERQRMRPWLIDLLDEQSCHQLEWINRNDKSFRVSWKHAAGQTFNPQSDCCLFERWAQHTGKYYPGDKPDPKRWKANFRCALNSLPDVDEDRQQGVRRGNNAFRVYRFLDQKKQKKSSQKCNGKTEEYDEESEDEYRPHYTPLGTRSRPKKVAQDMELDSEGSETGSSPGPLDWDTNTQFDDQEEKSPLPKIDELCQPFTQHIDKSFTAQTQRVPETHSPQASDDNDDGSDSNLRDEDIVQTISDLMTDEPQYWSTEVSLPARTQDAPDIYLDTTDSVLGPSVIVETAVDYMQDYNLSSLEFSQI